MGTKSLPRQSAPQANLDSLGFSGGKYINDTDAVTPDDGYVFFAVYVITTAEITLVGNIDGITSVSVPAGLTIYGRFTSCTLASGSVIAYHAV
jgi:hypothetical protein